MMWSRVRQWRLSARVGAVVAMDGAGVAHPDAAPGLGRGGPSGVRGPGLRLPCMQQRNLPCIAGERQGQPARVRAPRGSSPRAGCAGARWVLGLPRRLVAAGGRGRTAAGLEGAAGARAVCGIWFLAVGLTDMVGVPNRSDKE